MFGTDQRGSLQTRLKYAFETYLPVPAGTERHLAAALGEILQRTGNLVRGQLAYSIAMAFWVKEEPAVELAICP